jgi:hypothetical protein
MNTKELAPSQQAEIRERATVAAQVRYLPSSTTNLFLCFFFAQHVLFSSPSRVQRYTTSRRVVEEEVQQFNATRNKMFISFLTAFVRLEGEFTKVSFACLSSFLVLGNFL